MRRAVVVVVGVSILLTSCEGDDESSSGTPSVEAATEPEAVATSPATSDDPVTTDEITTTERATTTTGRPTTTAPPDPLDTAFAEAGLAPPTPQVADAIDTLCAEFTARNAEAINQVTSDAAVNPNSSTALNAGFSVLCPENAPLVGAVVMPNGDPAFPGYPLIVDVATIDNRVASWLEGKLVDGQVVALAPGVYTPYNPNVPDLIMYMTGPSDGDCILRDQFFPNTGGACWDGVQAGGGEPAQ